MTLDATIVVERDEFTLDVSLHVAAGRTLALVGPNGAGKSTAIGCIAGIVPLSAGRIELDGRVLDDGAIRVPVEQRRVGMVFQDYLLFPHLRVLDNVAFGPRARGMSRAHARDLAVDWLDRLGIRALADRLPGELSGGQSQVVALARVLASEPLALVLDEPLGALDVEVRADTRAELAAHLAEFTGPTIVVTHEIEDVVALGHDVVVLERGRATQRATVAQLLESPATLYAQRLVGATDAGR